jgi:hypothetical protein
MTNLTDKWKKGELPYAEYYIKLGGGEYTNDVWDVDGWQSFNKEGDVVVEVLAPVPSYDEWQQLKEYEQVVTSYNFKPIDYDIACEIVNKLLDEKKRLRQENKELKGLLKLNNILNKGSKSIYAWLKEDTAGEQKKLCADMFDKTVEMMSEINQVLVEE